jgi:hypothetical protein
MTAHARRAAVAAAALLGGCTSVESRYIGSPGHLEEVGGMPIVVQRPRWLKLTYREVVYGTRTAVRTQARSAPAMDGGPIGPDGWEDVDEGATPVEYRRWAPVVKIDAEVVKVGEAYALDFKRPLFGEITGDVTFPTKQEASKPEDYQYPTKVGATVDDQSLKKLNELVPDVAKKLIGVSVSAAPTPSEDVAELSSKVLCVELYDLRSSSAEPAFRFGDACRCVGGR